MRELRQGPVRALLRGRGLAPACATWSRRPSGTALRDLPAATGPAHPLEDVFFDCEAHNLQLRVQQAGPLLRPAAGPACCIGHLRLRLRSGQGGPPARQPGRRGGRLAECLPVVSDVCGGVPGLRRLLASLRMGSSGVPVVHRAPLWPALGCHVFQHILQIQRSVDSCSFSFLSTSTMHTSPTGPRAKGPGSRPFGT